MSKKILLILTILIFVGCKQVDEDTLMDVEKDDLETLSSNNSNEESITKELEKPEDKQNKDNNIKDNIYELLNNEDYIYDDSLINLYVDILNNEASFINKNYSSQVKEKITLNQLTVDEVIPLDVISYSVLDMDDDNVPELLVKATTGSVDFTIVLHYFENEVYSYWFSNRQMEDIKKDGTFYFSGRAGYFGVNRLKFEKDDYIIDEVAYYSAETDKEYNVIETYYLNKDKVNKDEFELFLNDFQNKEDIIWYEINSI